MRFVSKFSFIAAIFSVAILASVQSGSAANLMSGGFSTVSDRVNTSIVTNTNWRRSRIRARRTYRVIRRIRRIRRAPRQVPEINVYSGGAALVVLLFGMLLLRERFVRS